MAGLHTNYFNKFYFPNTHLSYQCGVNMSRHIRSAQELKELSMEILAQSRLRAKRESEALRRALGKRCRDWIVERPSEAQGFLRWLDAHVLESSERRSLDEVLQLRAAGDTAE